MNILNFKKTLPFMMKNKIPVFLWGSQGIGKTKTVYQYAQENDLGLVVLHTATQDVGDLIGLLVKGDDGTVHHARPEWFPTEGKGIIFLDELNRAAPDVIQAMFPFVTEGRLHRHVLPEGWYVMAAGNYNSGRFNVTDTSDAAWLSRFCHVDFTPSVEEWVMYADSKEMFGVADFIRNQPSALELSAKDAGRLDTSFIVPDRRAWTEGVGKLEQEAIPADIKYEIYSGLVGTAAAGAFISWKEKAEQGITLSQVLTKYEGNIRKKVRALSDNQKDRKFSVLNQPIDELFLQIEKNTDFLADKKSIANLKQFLLDIPKELAMKAFVKLSGMGAFAGRKELLNDPEYVKLYVQ